MFYSAIRWARARWTDRTGDVLATLVVLLVTFLYQFNSAPILNDHLYRIAAGRQILVGGAVPHRDFFDPGYLLTLYSSAAAQAVFGHSLLGELLLTAGFQALGFCLVFWLARRLSGAWELAAVAVLGAVIAEPRLYDYDKVLFLVLGPMACWRYIDRPGRARAAVVGIIAGIASLYRYDTGVYLGAGALAMLGVVHWSSWRQGLRELFWVLLGGALALAPAAMLMAHAGALGPYVRQVMQYASVEGRRTGLEPGRLPDLPAPNTGSPAVDVAVMVLFLALAVLPWLGLAAAFRRQRVGDTDGTELARVASLAAVAITANYFLLRDPLEARLGGVAGPGAIMAAWLIAVALGGRPVRPGSPPGRYWPAARRAVVLIALLNVGVLALWVPHLRERFEDSGLMSGPSTLVRRTADVGGAAAQVPPALDLLPDPGYAPLVRYLRDCTAPEDRVLAGWFAPEVAYFSGRLFAGGTAVFFGGHWSGEPYARRIVDRLRNQSVPIVLLRQPDTDLAPAFPAIAEFIDSEFAPVGKLQTSSSRFTVLAEVGRDPSGVHADLGLPCFGP